MNKNINENCIRTSDLTFATTLSLYFPISLIEREHSGKVIFVFNKTSELEKFSNKFWMNEVMVEPHMFANQTKNLKSRIYSGE